jgi:23S rRNA pseudouridine1911/1915/1917 synthase
MSIRPDGKEAHSFIRLEEDFNNYSLLDVSIKTGRTHQIRVHLASKKLSIVGDKTYNPSGNIAKNTPEELIEVIRDFPRQALHSSKLSFLDPETHEDISFNVLIPQDIKNLISQLKKHI